MYTVYVLILILETHCTGKMSYLLSISSMDHSRTETSHFRFLDQLQAFLQIDIRIRLYYFLTYHSNYHLSSKNERIIGLRYKLKHNITHTKTVLSHRRMKWFCGMTVAIMREIKACLLGEDVVKKEDQLSLPASLQLNLLSLDDFSGFHFTTFQFFPRFTLSSVPKFFQSRADNFGYGSRSLWHYCCC